MVRLILAIIALVIYGASMWGLAAITSWTIENHGYLPVFIFIVPPILALGFYFHFKDKRDAAAGKDPPVWF